MCVNMKMFKTSLICYKLILYIMCYVICQWHKKYNIMIILIIKIKEQIK